jgi:hypothetical protein
MRVDAGTGLTVQLARQHRKAYFKNSYLIDSRSFLPGSAFYPKQCDGCMTPRNLKCPTAVQKQEQERNPLS